MSSFLTQCPHCLTSFRVTDRQLDAAEGRVRCGACLGIFSAEANRIIVKPTPDEIAAADARELAAFDDDEGLDALDDAGTEDETRDDSDADALDDEEVDDEKDDDADDFDGDFDIPLGDLNLDIDDEEDENEFEETEDEPEDEYDDEGDDEETAEDDELEDDDGAQFDDEPGDEESELDADAAADERAAETLTANDTRLIDIVYEEYVDEDEADAQSAGEAEPEVSEEFEPEFIFEEEEEDFEDDDIEADDTAEEDDEDVEGDDELDEEDEPGEEDELEGEDELEEEDEDAPEEQPVDVEEIVYEEYTYTLADDTDDDAVLVDDEEDDEPVLVPPPRYPNQRGGSDKAALRNYLADIEDDEALDPLDDDALADLDEPVLLEAAPRRSRVAVFALLLANFALVAVLIWQYADEHVEQLSRSTSFAPLMPYACRVLDCPEPQRAQPDLFVSEQLLVRSHPRYAQALEVNLVFRNDAPEAQPFPALELGFHDTSNRMVANRLFQPTEYLPPELQTSEMPAQSSIQVTLELVDPGSDAVNYTLAFHAP